jgi:novobiocin biosynthesis protein NovU/D-mycarose 3-C-methyltransferase
MLDHFGSLVAELNPEHKPLKVIEIGSNDGFFLHYWLTHVAHSQILGIDPADNLVQIARDRGVATIEGLFDHQTAKTASMAIPEPDLIFARHVFCHIDNWQEFTNNLTRLTAKNTTVAIEVPYVLDMLEKGSFDQVYHEHLSYLSIRSMKALLHGSALYLHKVVRLPVHGGVILLLIKRRDCGQEADISVLKSLRGEYCGSKEWQRFAEKAKDQVAMLSNLVRELVNKGKRVCGLGASAKATVWMNACKFTKREISYVMDSTANKVYRSIPGTNIPVLNEGTHIFDACDYCIIFAWNFAEEILEREKQYVDLGGRFIVPIPELKIVPKEPGLLFGQLQE